MQSGYAVHGDRHIGKADPLVGDRIVDVVVGMDSVSEFAAGEMEATVGRIVFPRYHHKITMKDLLEGAVRFQTKVYPEKRDLFTRLAAKQTPRALFITCADSRVVPDMLTQCEPGYLFICRNAGNIVPTYGGSAMGGVSATIEYAVVALNIEHIVVLGHSDCGAMKGILHPDQVKHMPAVASWLHHGDIARLMVEENYPGLDERGQLTAIIEENIIAQVEHLRTHPSVATRLARNKVSIHGWLYNIENGSLWAFDADEGAFVPLDGRSSPSAVRRVRRKKDADGTLAGGL